MRVKNYITLGAILSALSLAGPVARAAAPATPQGSITFRTYPGDQRAAIEAGTAVPDGVFYPKRAEGPYNGYPGPDPGDDDTKPGSDVRNSYTLHLVGYFYPPRTGNIQLAIASDDAGSLFLSTDDTPANKRLIASEPTWNPVRAFGNEARRTRVNDGTQPADRLINQSPFIPVTANQPLYIEAYALEGGGGDNLAIAFRYDDELDFANDDIPIRGTFLSPFGVPTTAQIVSQPQNVFTYAGAPASFTAGVDVGPSGTLNSIKWTRNGVDIPDSNSATLTVTPAAADSGAVYRAIIDTSLGTIQSNDATLTVSSVANEFAPGVMRFEAWKDITGTAVADLKADPRYPATPDEVRPVFAYEGVPSFGDNYGARVSGFIIPKETGNYVFFISTDDNGELYLSTDDTAANKKLIASESTWSNSREWTVSGGGSDLTSKRSDQFISSEWPTGNVITLTAGQRYYTELLYKEGGGGDFGAVTMIKEGAADPATGSITLTGSLIGGNARPELGDVTITTQPVFPAQLEEGRTYRITVDGMTTPAGYNFPLNIQWQRNGTPIPGATGKTLIIQNADAADAGTYRAVLSVASGKTVNSNEATLAVVPDTFAPVPAAGALLKNAKQEIGVGFDENVNLATANVLANYSLNAGTIDSIRVVNRPATGFAAAHGVQEFNGIVLVASGLTPGQTYQLTVRNVADPKGNAIPAAGVTVSFRAEDKKTWTIVGSTESGFPQNDAVRISEGGFDIVSSGVAFWSDYDEATFVNEKVTGDFDAKVQLVEQDPSSQWARTGLMAREALDEGKGRPDRAGTAAALENGVYTIPREQLFSRLQTVHANPPALWDLSVASNNSYENHYRDETTFVRGWNDQMQSADGGFGPMPYPDVWMRMKREGNFLVTFRSVDGQTWNQMTRREFPNLTADLFVGPFFAPELGNNGARDGLGHGVLARFRNYSISTGTSGGSFTAIRLQGGEVVIEFTGAGVQSADTVLGPWTDVAGTSPLRVQATGPAKFYRFRP